MPRELPDIGPNMAPAMQAVLTSVYSLINKDKTMTRESILRGAAKVKFKTIKGVKAVAMADEFENLVLDEVLVDKDSNGEFRLDLGQLEERIEIYNQTP